MKDRTFVFFLIVATIVCSAELFVILTTISPETANPEVFWLLFLCFFISFSGILSLIWHPLKLAIHRSTTLSRWTTLRQTSLLSLVITLLVFFKSLSILSIWDSVPLVISVILIEFFFQADKNPLHEPR